MALVNVGKHKNSDKQVEVGVRRHGDGYSVCVDFKADDGWAWTIYLLGLLMWNTEAVPE